MSSRPVESHDARRVEQAREQAAGNCYEAVPTVWDEERESRFFGVVRDVLPPRFLFAAGVLLASYDPPEVRF